MRQFFLIIPIYFFFFPLASFSQSATIWNEEINTIRSRKDISDSLKITLISDFFLEKSYLINDESLSIYLDNTLPLVGQLDPDEAKAYIYSYSLLLTTDIEQKLPLLDSCMFYLKKSTIPKFLLSDGII